MLWSWVSVSLSHAHVALPHVVPLLPGVRQREGSTVVVGDLELHPGQPEAVDVGKVVACAAWPLALHEGLRSKVCETAAGRRQRLTATLVTGARVLRSQQTSQC